MAVSMKVKRQRDEIRASLRQKLDTHFELFCEVAAHSETPKDETCYQAGISAFQDAIKFGSVFADVARTQPFLRSAYTNLSKAVEGAKYSASQESKEDLANQKSGALFALLSTRELLEGREHPRALDELQASLEAISCILTEDRIDATADRELSRYELDDWARYLACYIGLQVLFRLWGGTPDSSSVVPLSKSASSEKYKEMVTILAELALAPSVNEMDFATFDRVYARHITLENYKLSIVDGFLFSDAYIFSVIRCRGALVQGVVTMFD